MPVMFLSDLEAASYGRYGGSVPRADLERFFYLDDAGQALVAGCGVITIGSVSVSSSPRFVISAGSWPIRWKGRRPGPSTTLPATCRLPARRVWRGARNGSG